MLTITSVSKNFGDTKALQNVSFEIKPGEIFSLIGPNSSGKTTLIKSIIGLVAPTHGKIEIGGHDISKDPLQAKALIGYIPDEPSVWSYMTGEEFLRFTNALYPKHKKLHLKEELETFALNGVEKKFFEEYSRGNKQKFSILAALSHHPKLLLVDEPIVGLDPTGAEIAKRLFKEFAQNGGAVLLVTHTLPVAEEISTKIGFLKSGTLVTQGTMSELREKADLGDDASLTDIYKQLS